MKKILLWVLSFLITASFAVFQRMTGPTYPVKASHVAVPGAELFSYRLPRSCTIGEYCGIWIKSATRLEGHVQWTRYNTGDVAQRLPLVYNNGWLFGYLPEQPPAGKLEYQVFVKTAQGETALAAKPLVTRFRGAVPGWILIPHIILMFLFMLTAVRIFLTAAFGAPQIKHSVPATFVFLLLGGFVFGPLTQYYAFGQAWTGFPFGYDLTDNKTLLMLVAWLPAMCAVLRKKPARLWLNVAFAVTATVYLVPHSMFGSELDYKKGEVVTGK
ncbi:MAG: hypothetical protein A2234_10555 [Elusimicrobia bacterium RIFOXYA2_FULL_58_8]|nr:MAG: hypothetical protein A2234_10555 [Elusimicrobia bacterium RIFOXYA2_FULL_58_8]